jgi:hypothetical protein
LITPMQNLDTIIVGEYLGKNATQSLKKGNRVPLGQEVILALKNLSACVNVSTGLSHPLDKQHAKDTFSKLAIAREKWIRPHAPLRGGAEESLWRLRAASFPPRDAPTRVVAPLGAAPFQKMASVAQPPGIIGEASHLLRY